ncbi:hypothetical protein M408DRAFT_162974 [Serendipita vermifera MAFF 305830]|uniref:Uncharacterized protein n=1 Tax=Serendipita vermifera MAFF 305830 TaxID=933852 RepID=A0A0C3B8B8_SERVB|nr:hypothetical protein M408DRAFT_162974 [Serendipita vermifera MAFF 305830]
MPPHCVRGTGPLDKSLVLCETEYSPSGVSIAIDGIIASFKGHLSRSNSAISLFSDCLRILPISVSGSP